MSDGRPAQHHSLSPERTALAWSRTGLAALALAGVLLKAGVSRDDPLTMAASGVALATAAFLYVCARVRQANARATPTVPGPAWMLATSLCCVAAASVALAGLV
jgi:uncharacterized membrane protein YidH (DUF202 family)